MVEVVSPSTRTTDTITKRATCAAWGMLLYMVVDLESCDLTWHGSTGVAT